MTEPPALGGPISSNEATNPAGAISAIAGQQQGQQDDPDVWIAQLMQCKPLSEAEVKRLCDKVSTRSEREERSDEGEGRDERSENQCFPSAARISFARAERDCLSSSEARRRRRLGRAKRAIQGRRRTAENQSSEARIRLFSSEAR
jgi:hypothetical protein